jgi:hypothetical protein
MGCILFELATGAMPFAGDYAVERYAQQESELGARCHTDIGLDMAKRITDTIQAMFQMRPSLRPKSASLAKLFDEYYHSAKDEGPVQKIEESPSVNTVVDLSCPIGAKQSGVN